MPRFKALKYREVTTILNNLGFIQESGTGSSHQTWTLKRNNKSYAVTVAFHGTNLEFRPGTLGSMIRQSGFSKEEFYQALKK
ncbi:MAG: type II toxin-antitoxin system HicA family toxin [Candidatus Daviesbacteria bacterium]|nr:type II toxin-antitoxin system HicA family toxin [Candidatus Daviesbacteria bacterium]